jgi:serine/threonine-protein kinase
MPTRELSPVPVALGSATTDTEEGRAFFQDRLRLSVGWMFVLAFGFYSLNILDAMVGGVGVLLEASTLWHGLACLTLGGVWVLTRVTRCSLPLLLVADSAGLILTCLFFAAMGAALALDHDLLAGNPVHPILIGQLACMSTILTRAVALPSTPRRTFWLGIAALLPQVIFSGYVFATSDSLPGAPTMALTNGQLLFGNLVNIVGWCGVALAISTMGSRVIFGLRTEADKIKKLGQYTLEEKIGEGGMGIVYRASHAMLRRPTAIKLLPPEKAGEESIRRFEHEVQLTAQLSHPNTIAIFDYGRTPTGVFYYAMEYLDGLTLEDLVTKHGPQKPGRVIRILQQVSGALTEAHENGLIHRDIKPANIILCERGGVPDVAKVVDFGLVKSVIFDDTDTTMMVTRQNVLIGTPQYMAPEAIRGEQFVDGRSDLYALGGVGVFLLTGAPVFPGESLVEVVAHHLHTAPTPPSQRGIDQVPPDLEAVLMRCLEKEPAARFATARELAAALVPCGRSSPWSIERATQFWSGCRNKTGDSRPAASTAAPPTLAVDIDDRLTDPRERPA